MFNETSWPTCKTDEIATDVGGDSPVCLTQAEWEAFEVEQAKVDKNVVNVKPKPGDAWTNYVIYGGLALLAFALIKR